MEAVSNFWFWFVLIILFITAYWHLNVPSNLPPGSAGLPIVGYLPFIGNTAHVTLTKLGQKYGSIYHLYLGSRLIVVLNDYAAIREAFVKHGQIFAGRPADFLYKDLLTNTSGLLSTDGEYWKQHRRFVLSNLKDYGVGKLVLQPMILNEIFHFLKEVKKQNGKSCEIKQLLNSSTANNVHILVTGKRYDYDHPTMDNITQILRNMETAFPEVDVAMYFPWIKILPGCNWIRRTRVIPDCGKRFMKAVKDIVEDTTREYKEGQHENYVQAYSTERNSRLSTNKNENVFTETGLVHVTRDLLMAGTETTSSTLHWGLLYMTLHPQIQKKVQKEIDHVIGRDREPSYSDRTNMPYTEATIMEIHRIISLVPLSLPHRNTQEMSIFGHRIPKDTVIIPNIYAVHRDPEIWGDPENFIPERFIGPEGQLIKTEYVIPFSIGKRACAGEPLARMEMFLYFVSLLQHFNFVPPDGQMPTLEQMKGFLKRAKFQLVCAQMREH